VKLHILIDWNSDYTIAETRKLCSKVVATLILQFTK